MVMFTGEVKTYLDVRNHVVATYGPLDEASEYAFVMFLGNALDSMWADLRSTPWYLSEWTISKTEGDVFLLPADLARICSATGTFEQPEDEDDPPVPDVTYDLHMAACSGSQGSCAPRNEVTWGCTPSSVVRASVGATAIVPPGSGDELPLSIKVIGYRHPGPPFFTVTGSEDEPCRNWKDIDLPALFRNVYSKAVVGMMFFGGDDAPRGADWLNLANSEFSALKRANPGLVQGSPSERGMYQMGSRSYLGHGSCCELGGDWWRSL